MGKDEWVRENLFLIAALLTGCNEAPDRDRPIDNATNGDDPVMREYAAKHFPTFLMGTLAKIDHEIRYSGPDNKMVEIAIKSGGRFPGDCSLAKTAVLEIGVPDGYMVRCTEAGPGGTPLWTMGGTR
jgi:hypothetical protein